MRRLLTGSVAALVIAGCSDTNLPPLAPELPSGGGVSFAVMQGGDGGTYFLPPLMHSTFSGVFDADRSPEIVICSGEPAGPCADPVASFHMAEGEPTAQTIRVVPEDEHYIVNWRTQGVPHGNYRIFVIEGGSTHAWIDVVVVENGKQMKDYKGSDLPVINGTLPIKVRLERVHGLLAEYYHMVGACNQCTFPNGTFVASRIESTINIVAGNGSFWPGVIRNDLFSVRWTGFVGPLYSEEYTFCTTTDDGVRLWIAGELIVDAWVQQAPTEHCGTIELDAGRKFSLRMEYFENFSGARAQLRWESASQAREFVPSNAFFLY